MKHLDEHGNSLDTWDSKYVILVCAKMQKRIANAFE